MECKAQLIDISKDWREGGYQVVFHADHINKDEDLSGQLRLQVKKWREKRSLSANAYYWILLTSMAECLDSTKEELHEEMLRRYGKEWTDEDGNWIVSTLPNRVDINNVYGHWRRWKSDGHHTAYIMLKGTSEMDSKEFSYLVDRVVEECQDLGIQTMTPEELIRLEGYEKLGSR